MHIAFDDPAESGRALGHDLYRLTRLHDSLDWPRCVREGYYLARATRVPRSAADVYQRKWLQLRLSAQARGRFVSDEVTPHYLRRIDVAICPVLRIPLTRGTLGDTDWSIDRLNNTAAYAANNLAVMSTRANRAKGERDFDEVLRLARLDVATEGLTPAEWLRLAALMLGPCFAAHPAEAPDIPMPVPIPNCTVRMATQQVQFLLASRCERHAGKNALVKSLRTVLDNDHGAGSCYRRSETDPLRRSKSDPPGTR